MIYPTLLFTEQTPKKRIKTDVYEDMKLDLLLSSEVIDIMSIPCGASDITERQQIFSELTSTDNDRYSLLAEFSELSDIATKITMLYDDYTAAVCDGERNVLCAAVIHEMLRFSNKASDINSCASLCTRFSDAFKNRCGESVYKAIESELDELKPQLDSIRTYICTLSGKAQHLSRADANKNPGASPKEGYLSRLLDCAKSFGFADISIEKTPRRLNAGITEAAMRLYPEQFGAFARFYEKYNGYIEPEILKYRAELNFYLSVSALIKRVKENGIPVCYPRVSEKSGVTLRSAYDITLLEKGEKNIIPNNASFTKDEPFFFLTGANGGGKTTYLRTVGVSVLLFLCGAPVPCEDAELSPLYGVYTHFPRDERFELSGRFLDEQNRVSDILEEATESSLVLLNETYSTTGEEKAIRCTAELASTLRRKGVFGIYVTHQDISEHPESEASNIPFLNVLLDSDGEKRTYKVARRKNTEGSHAQDVLKKYALDRASLAERFGI